MDDKPRPQIAPRRPLGPAPNRPALALAPRMAATLAKVVDRFRMLRKIEPMTDLFYSSRQWRRLRAACLRRDRNRCIVAGCGRRAARVDYIVARKDGGADHIGNLRSLCAEHATKVSGSRAVL